MLYVTDTQPFLWLLTDDNKRLWNTVCLKEVGPLDI